MSNATTNTASTAAAAAAAATTTVPRAAPATSSLAASARFRTFAVTFSTFGPLIYCVCQFFNWPMFTFHPATNRLVWGYEGPRPGEGPNMLWYGWTLTTILIATALGLIAMMLPERITSKIPLSLIWIFPILTIPYVVYSLMPWWLAAAK
jgi:hypothetical protein